MNNAHIDSSAHMKMDSWPILTRLLETKKKKRALNPLRSLQTEVSGVITLYCESERGGGVVWPSSLSAAPLQNALTVKREGGTILGHVIVFTQSVSHPSLCGRIFALPSGVAIWNSLVGNFKVRFKHTPALTDDAKNVSFGIYIGHN